MRKKKVQPNHRRRTLRLPYLDHSKLAVLNSLGSPGSRRVYEYALDQFIAWYCSEARLAFNRIVVTQYRMFLESRHLAANTIRYSYPEATGRLPLYVMVDKDTWSAAEYFAALLQDNHAATVIGELTGGAGCGYTNGGIPTQLRNSKAEVQIPDCVRLRADGSDEVDGVTPDVLIPWAKRDSAYQRARKLIATLSTIANQ